MLSDSRESRPAPRVLRVELNRRDEVTLRTDEITRPEGQEREPAQRADVPRVVPQRFGPRVERRVPFSAIGMDAREEIVRGGELRIPRQATAHHRGGRVELATASQGFGEIEEDETAGLGREPLRQGANVVGHGATFSPSAMMRAASRNRTTDARWRSSSAGRPWSRSHSLHACSASSNRPSPARA